MLPAGVAGGLAALYLFRSTCLVEEQGIGVTGGSPGGCKWSILSAVMERAAPCVKNSLFY